MALAKLFIVDINSRYDRLLWEAVCRYKVSAGVEVV